jgi:DNA modification methylase
MTAETFLDGRITLHCGDSRGVLKTIADCSIDSIVTDPPYALVSIVKRFGKAGSAAVKVPEDGSGAYARASAGFMGKAWDTGETAFATEFWAECLRVLKPGGHVVAFSGTRTYHRMAVAIEDAGFEVRDMLSWLYGSGFPKSHDVAKGLDKRGGHHRGKAGMPVPFQSVAKGQEYERTPKGAPVLDEAKEWDGWGTALKPACEPICFGRKPMRGTVAANVLEHGTGAINIDGCRIGEREARELNRLTSIGFGGSEAQGLVIDGGKGRWPANIVHDGSADVFASFPDIVDEESAARFFYTAKADADDRLGSKHPTVKPVDLMQWLCRLVTPKGGTVLDPFAGTGTTGEAAFREGFKAVLIEREEEYQADIRRRMALCMAGPDERKRESIKAKVGDLPFEAGSLFAPLGAAE